MRNWPTLPFDEAVEDVSGGNVKTKQNDYAESGEFAIVDQGKALIAGYTDDAAALCKAPLPVVVFGDHTRCLKFVDFPFGMGADGVKVLKPKAGLDTKFLYHHLRHIKLPDGGYDRHFKYLKRETVPLPPFSEQRRIAAILDQAETLRTQRRTALALLDSLTQSLFLDMFGDPVANPKGWQREKLGNLTSKMGSGSTPLGGDAAYKAEGISLIRSLNVHDGEFKYKNLAYIDEIQAAKLSNVQVAEGDVLLNITGASVARVCRAPSDVLPARVNQHVMIVRPKSALNGLFLERMLLSETMKRALLQIGGAGATREAITKAQAEELLVLLPPLPLQQTFSTRIESIAALKTTHRRALAALDALFASLQQRAFTGAL